MRVVGVDGCPGGWIAVAYGIAAGPATQAQEANRGRDCLVGSWCVGEAGRLGRPVATRIFSLPLI